MRGRSIKTTGSVAAIIQARIGSSRLPGKSLARVYKHYSLIEMVLLRVLRAEKPDTVVLATSEDKDCDPLEELSSGLGVITVRGSETDVLSRFEIAIRQVKCDAVVRICADNPLIDYGEIDKLITFFQDNNFDYAANNTRECGLPDGFGCEIVKASLLLDISSNIREQIYREHVTNYITNNPSSYSLGWLKAEEHLRRPELKLDIDTKDDFTKMQELCSLLPEENSPYWTAGEIIKVADSGSVI